LISKKEYAERFLGGFVKNYFGNSYRALASFFTNEKNLSIKEMEEIRKMMDEEIKKQNKGNND
jgi:predicted transcriptional regulator